jgi:hypothetical protein
MAYDYLGMRDAFIEDKLNILRANYNQVPHNEPINPIIDFPWCIY